MTALPQGEVESVYRAAGDQRRELPFVTTAAAVLTLDHYGIVGDLHGGAQRRAGAREPWLPRGAVLRNERQVSALCRNELAAIAARLGLSELRSEWLGANLLISGLAAFSHIPPGSRLAFGGRWGGRGRFDGGAVLRVEAYNVPCRRAGRAVAAATGRPELELAFVQAARVLRGLVLSVDLAGPIAPSDPVVVLPPLLPPGATAR